MIGLWPSIFKASLASILVPHKGEPEKINKNKQKAEESPTLNSNAYSKYVPLGKKNMRNIQKCLLFSKVSAVPEHLNTDRVHILKTLLYKNLNKVLLFPLLKILQICATSTDESSPRDP